MKPRPPSARLGYLHGLPAWAYWFNSYSVSAYLVPDRPGGYRGPLTCWPGEVEDWAPFPAPSAVFGVTQATPLTPQQLRVYSHAVCWALAELSYAAYQKTVKPRPRATVAPQRYVLIPSPC